MPPSRTGTDTVARSRLVLPGLPHERNRPSLKPVISYLLSRLPLDAASRSPDAIALRTRNEQLSYADLGHLVERVAGGLCGIGLQKQDRVAIYLPKRVETVASCFGTSLAGGVFVPVNPLLKAPQVGHILRDSGASVLVTSADRLTDLAPRWPSRVPCDTSC